MQRIGLIAGLILVAGTGIGLYEALKTDEKPEDSAVMKARKVIRLSNGRALRIVGAQAPEGSVISADAIHGDVVDIPIVPNGAECVVVFRAFVKEEHPDFPDIKFDLGSVVMASPPDESGVAIWSALIRGDNCRLAGYLDGYLGSTFEELDKLPEKDRIKLLKRQANGKSSFLVEWSGRSDLQLSEAGSL